MRSGVNCVLCKQSADFDGAVPVYDDRNRHWCQECAGGVLASVETSPDLVVRITKEKKLWKAEKLERQAAELRKEAEK